jgi:hypothetical protein
VTDLAGQVALGAVGAGMVAGPAAAVWAGCYLIGRILDRWRS